MVCGGGMSCVHCRLTAALQDGRTALHLACLRRHVAVAELLIARGADVSATSKVSRRHLRGEVLSGCVCDGADRRCRMRVCLRQSDQLMLGRRHGGDVLSAWGGMQVPVGARWCEAAGSVVDARSGCLSAELRSLRECVRWTAVVGPGPSWVWSAGL